MTIRQIDPADPVLDPTVALDLVHRHLPSASEVTAVEESGGEARAYMIDDGYVLKTQRPHRVRASTSLEKESFHLRELERQLVDVPVPSVLGYGRAEEVEYIVMTKMAGVAASTVEILGEMRQTMLSDLGKLLRRIHGVDLEPFIESGLFPGDRTSVDIKSRIDSGFRAVVDALGTRTGLWNFRLSPEEVALRARRPFYDESRVALHTNPGPEHVFVDPSIVTFTGLIDFGDAYVSHPAFDLRRWTSPDDQAALIMGYTAAGEVSDAFVDTWHTISILGAMQMVLRRPNRREESFTDLDVLLAEMV